MDADVKTALVKALRSGKYKQGRSVLRDVGDKFCCLGVLCDIIDPSKWDGGGSYDGATSFPPRGVLAACKVSTDSGGHHKFWPLARMNDDGKSFSEIADYIEAHL